jgi:hypothetical protein
MPVTFYICLYSMTLVGIIGVLRYNHLNTPMRFIAWNVVCATISGWTEHILGSHYQIHTLWLFHLNTFIELVLVLFAFYHWRTGTRHGKLLQWSFYVYAIIWLVGMFTFEPLTMSDDYSGSIAQVIQLGFSIWLLIAILKDDTVVWTNDPRFWVTSGIIIYVAFTFLLFGLFDVMLSKSSSMLRVILHINWYAIIISYVFFLRAFFCNPAPAGTIQQTTLETRKSA